jgi:hypothetical protein
MGWTDEHLHHFVISDETYSVVSRDGVMIGDDSTDEKKIKLNKVIPGEKFKFTYEYDFGDSWLHNILVEKIFVPDEELKAPVCLKGKRCTPPEDCGGIGGYYHLCRVVGDPDHPEHAEMLDWIGYEYDPEYFSAEIVTAQLQHLR